MIRSIINAIKDARQTMHTLHAMAQIMERHRRRRLPMYPSLSLCPQCCALRTMILKESEASQ